MSFYYFVTGEFFGFEVPYEQYPAVAALIPKQDESSSGRTHATKQLKDTKLGLSYLALCVRPVVQKELTIDADQIALIAELIQQGEKLRTFTPDLTESLEEQKVRYIELRQQRVEFGDKASREVKGLLSAKQLKRARQLKFQSDVRSGSVDAILQQMGSNLPEEKVLAMRDEMRLVGLAVQFQARKFRFDLISNSIDEVLGEGEMEKLMGKPYQFAENPLQPTFQPPPRSRSNPRRDR